MEVSMKQAWKFVVFFELVLLCGSCLAGNLVGRNAPEITIREWITSNPPDIKSLENRIYVIEFWATWCAPCKESIPHLIKLADKYRESGVLFISLSADKSADAVRKFVRKKGINYHVAIDSGTADGFEITGYPTAFVVNHKGKVIWQGQPRERKFEQAIDKAINGGPPPLLAGVDLGVFESFREALWGGIDFAGAYNQIRLCADNGSSEDSQVAKRIITTIDKRISERIADAERLWSEDLLGAYSIYVDVITKYDGIAAVEPAKKAYQELKKYGDLGQQQPVAKKTEKAVE